MRPHELPGLWFSERELYSLLMAHQLLSELDADGVISRHLQPPRDLLRHLRGECLREDANRLQHATDQRAPALVGVGVGVAARRVEDALGDEVRAVRLRIARRLRPGPADRHGAALATVWDGLARSEGARGSAGGGHQGFSERRSGHAQQHVLQHVKTKVLLDLARLIQQPVQGEHGFQRTFAGREGPA